MIFFGELPLFVASSPRCAHRKLAMQEMHFGSLRKSVPFAANLRGSPEKMGE
jgi:hypothetical protein